MQMYVILPVVLLIVGKLSGGRPATVGWIIAALFALTFTYALLKTARNQSFASKPNRMGLPFRCDTRGWERVKSSMADFGANTENVQDSRTLRHSHRFFMTFSARFFAPAKPR